MKRDKSISPSILYSFEEHYFQPFYKILDSVLRELFLTVPVKTYII